MSDAWRKHPPTNRECRETFSKVSSLVMAYTNVVQHERISRESSKNPLKVMR